MNREERLELALSLYKDDINVKLTDDECLELSDLLKRGSDFENEMEHYFKEFEDTGITEEERAYLRTHTFKFEFYVLCENIYLVLDDGKLDMSLLSASTDFQNKFFEILKRKKEKME